MYLDPSAAVSGVLYRIPEDDPGDPEDPAGVWLSTRGRWNATRVGEPMGPGVRPSTVASGGKVCTARLGVIGARALLIPGGGSGSNSCWRLNPSLTIAVRIQPECRTRGFLEQSSYKKMPPPQKTTRFFRASPDTYPK